MTDAELYGMARQRERAIHELERGTIAFYFGDRLFMRLGDRTVVIGRKRITERFWALMVSNGGAGELVAEGNYRIFQHDGHSHLAFELQDGVDFLNLPRRGSFIVTVMNPDVTVWQGEPHPFQEDLF